MLHTLNSLGHNQFEFARWAPDKYDHYKIIRVQPISDDERRWSTVIQNLMIAADSRLVRTSYVYDYKPRQHLFYRNRWWEIRSVADVTLDVNPQALSLVNNVNSQFILELGEVDGFDA